jgi:hypothetical protein
VISSYSVAFFLFAAALYSSKVSLPSLFLSFLLKIFDLRGVLRAFREFILGERAVVVGVLPFEDLFGVRLLLRCAFGGSGRGEGNGQREGERDQGAGGFHRSWSMVGLNEMGWDEPRLQRTPRVTEHSGKWRAVLQRGSPEITRNRAAPWRSMTSRSPCMSKCCGVQRVFLTIPANTRSRTSRASDHGSCCTGRISCRWMPCRTHP